MSLDEMSNSNDGRRSTPASVQGDENEPISTAAKDITMSDSKIPKPRVLTNQNEIFGVLDMSPPMKKPEQTEACITKRSQKTSATSSHQDSPTRPEVTNEERPKVSSYKSRAQYQKKSILFKPKFDLDLTGYGEEEQMAQHPEKVNSRLSRMRAQLHKIDLSNFETHEFFTPGGETLTFKNQYTKKTFKQGGDIGEKRYNRVARGEELFQVLFDSQEEALNEPQQLEEQPENVTAASGAKTE